MSHAIETWHSLGLLCHLGLDLLFAARSEYDAEHPMSPNRLVHELYLDNLEHLRKVGTLWLSLPQWMVFYIANGCVNLDW